MDVESLVKVTGATLSVAGLLGSGYKWALSEHFSKIGRLREEYKFAKELFADLASSKEMHPFQKAKGYQAISGVIWIGVDEGDYLTSVKDPARAMSRYVKGYDYLMFVPPTSGGPRVDFLPRYVEEWSRAWRRWAYTIEYGVFGLLAFGPPLFGLWVVKDPGQWVFTAIGSLVIFGPLSFLSLDALAKLVAAERLAQEQSVIAKSNGLITIASR